VVKSTGFAAFKLGGGCDDYPRIDLAIGSVYTGTEVLSNAGGVVSKNSVGTTF
jgi:hypothetical protein